MVVNQDCAHLSLREWALACSLLFCLSQSRRALSSSHWRFLRSFSRSFSLSLGRTCFPAVEAKSHKWKQKNVVFCYKLLIKKHFHTSFCRATSMTSLIFSLLLLSVVRLVFSGYLLWRLDSQRFIFLCPVTSVKKTSWGSKELPTLCCTSFLNNNIHTLMFFVLLSYFSCFANGLQLHFFVHPCVV